MPHAIKMRSATLWNTKETEFLFVWDENHPENPVNVTITFKGSGLHQTTTHSRADARKRWETLKGMGWTQKEEA